MIERVYIDNVWSYVNFEWRPGPLAMLLGANGSGKTALLQTLDRVQTLLLGESTVAQAFPERSRTRWDDRREQTIELDIAGNGGRYQYRLVVVHDPNAVGKPLIQSERLTFDSQLVAQLEWGGLKLFNDDGTETNAPFRVRATRSGIGAVDAGNDLQRLLWFKKWVSNVWLLRPDPRSMSGKVEGIDAESLEENLANFAAWYLYQLRQKPGSIFKANQAIAQIMPGFLELFEQNGQLRARFGDETNHHDFWFGHLSDGQRAIIALYVLRHVVAVPGKTLVVDEPDNYVALREIQPWLTELMDLALRKDGPQIWLISHHPEILNLLARDYGWLFYRDGTGPTRVKRFALAEGLDAAETIARGWEDA